MDRLKHYLSSNRDLLSEEEPGEAVWDAICRQTEQKPVRKVVFLNIARAAAACVALFACAGILLWLNKAPDQPVKTRINPPIATATGRLKQELVQRGSVRQPVKESRVAVLSRRAIARKESVTAELSSTEPETVLRSIREIAGLVEIQKTLISSTPVAASHADQFSVLVNNYRALESEQQAIESDLRSGAAASEVLLDRLIINLKRRVSVLESLKREIDKVNAAGQSSPETAKTYVDII